jgi:hypothetical protein
VTLSNSPHAQVGTGNVQNFSDIGKLITAVDSADANNTEKEEAKSLLEKLTNNKVVLAILKRFGLNV